MLYRNLYSVEGQNWIAVCFFFVTCTDFWSRFRLLIFTDYADIAASVVLLQAVVLTYNRSGLHKQTSDRSIVNNVARRQNRLCYMTSMPSSHKRETTPILLAPQQNGFLLKLYRYDDAITHVMIVG